MTVAPCSPCQTEPLEPGYSPFREYLLQLLALRVRHPTDEHQALPHGVEIALWRQILRNSGNDRAADAENRKLKGLQFVERAGQGRLEGANLSVQRGYDRLDGRGVRRREGIPLTGGHTGRSCQRAVSSPIGDQGCERRRDRDSRCAGNLNREHGRRGQQGHGVGNERVGPANAREGLAQRLGRIGPTRKNGSLG